MNNAPNCTGNATGTGDYTATGGSCLKRINVQFTHGSACRLNGTYVINDILIGCGVDVETSDCPLGTSYSVATISFTVVSDNFCANVSTNNVVDNAITVDQFIAPNPRYLLYNESDANNNAGITTWQWGTFFFMRMHFLGLKVYECTAIDLITNWGAGYASVKTQVNLTATQTGAIPPQYGLAQKPAGLGLDVDNQAFLMMAMLDTNMIGNPTDQAQYAFGPPRGARATLGVRVTIQVSYYDASAGRRRRRQAYRQPGVTTGRRQAGFTNSASLGLEPQSIVPYGDDSQESEDLQGTPSSAQAALPPYSILACLATALAIGALL